VGRTFLPLGPLKSPLMHGLDQEAQLAYPSRIFFAKRRAWTMPRHPSLGRTVVFVEFNQVSLSEASVPIRGDPTEVS
jgi:hypothetical protein